MAMFSKAVDMAVVAKWFLYCKSVPKKVTMNTKSKYQKFMAVSGAVWAICSSDQLGVMSLVSSSGNMETKIEKITNMSINRKKMAVANTPFCFEEINDGMNAWVNAPSAKIRLKRLGSLKATKKMSVQMEAPRAEAMVTSRPRAVTRENRMPKLLVNIDFNFMGFFLDGSLS